VSEYGKEVQSVAGIGEEKAANDLSLTLKTLPSHSPKPFILRFGQQPRIFDLRGGLLAAEDAGDFAGGVGLAVDVGFI
jgi:hypothetical protein